MVSDNEQQREALAEYAHDCWSRWMTHLLSRTTDGADRSATIPAEDARRWNRQRVTAYGDLTEQEQTSDRAEADRMIDALHRAGFVIQRRNNQEVDSHGV